MAAVRRFILVEIQTGTGLPLRAGSIRWWSLLREDQNMSRAINRDEAMVPELELTVPEKAIGLLPIVLPILGTVLLIMIRIQAGRPIGFIYCDALIMLALISYICAAVL